MAEDVHTGGMIALVPDAESARELVVPDGEVHAQLHLTLAYLGDDVAVLTEAQRAELRRHVETAAAAHGPILGRIFAHATFNPDGWADREPCAVYLVGECPELVPLAARFAAVAPVPQHDPFIPHITAGYGHRADELRYTGPIVFDRLRLALGEDVVDVELSGESGQKSAGAPDGLRGHFAAGVREGLAGLDPDEGHIAAELLEYKAGPPGASFPSPDPGATRLRHYWTRTTEGLRKWRPGQPGAFKRLVKRLRKYVGPRAEGLAAIYYRTAKGYWPGRHSRRGRKDGAPLTLDELLLGVVAQYRQDARGEGKAAGARWEDDEELVGEDDPELDPDFDAGAEGGTEDEDELYASLERFAGLDLTTDEAWEEALADEVEWTAEADGTLRREDRGDARDGTDESDESDEAEMLDLFDEEDQADRAAGVRR